MDLGSFQEVQEDIYVPVGELPAVLEQHYIFHSVLNLLSIRTEVYDEAYDIFEAEE